MMSAFDFYLLPLEEKIKKVYEDGNFVLDIRYYGYKINLYLIYDFYVEVFYHHLNDKIEKIEPLNTSHSRMKFYTDQIKLEENF
jgi:hypothetical protein